MTKRNDDRARTKADVMLDDMLAGTRGALSLRECYAAITGDERVTGDWSRCKLAVMRESMGADYVEALTSASWAVALGDAMERRLHVEYAARSALASWKRIAVVGSPANFRDQQTFRIGGFGNLPTVAEEGSYTALSEPDDLGGTYRVAKRGGTASVTLEMIANDDTGALRRIPEELALAAMMTLYEFVFDFIRTNPVIYDGEPLFGAAHGNLGSSALGAASYHAAAVVVAKQARHGSGKRIGFGRKNLLIPLDLQQVGYETFIKGRGAEDDAEIMPNVIMVPYWTDVNDWALVNDPAYEPTIEVGFLGGNEEPEIILQSEQAADSVFTHDRLTYKLRHIYGGRVLGFGGMFKSVVAG